MALEMGLGIMHYHENAAISAALVADGKILWTLELGYSDPAAKTPVTQETMFGIGSVSKVITAAAVMKLVDQGLVRLDEPLTAYLRDFHMQSPEYKDITVRMLLNHSSGLPGFNCRGSVTDRPWTEYQNSTYQAIKQSRLKHQPGYMHVYCNDGFTLLERVVQAATGKPFTNYVEEEIFIPLGMTRSCYSTNFPSHGSFARAFHKGRKLPLEVVNTYAAAGVYTTTQDMARFISMITDRGDADGTGIISRESLEAMEQNQITDTFRVVDSNFLTFGLGWDNTFHPGPGSKGKKALTKNGGTFKYSAELWVLPEEKLGLAVFAVNAPCAVLEDLAEKTIMAALVDKGVLNSMPEPAGQPLSPPAVPSQELLNLIAGYYAGCSRLFRVSVLPGKNIKIDIREQGRWYSVFQKLRYHKNGTFISEGDPYQYFSFQEADGRTYLVMHSLRDYYTMEIPIAQRLKETEPLPSAWISRLNKNWLIANGIANSYSFYFDTYPKLNFEVLNDLPGYLFAWEPWDYMTFMTGPDEDIEYMAIQIPMSESRNLSDLEVVRIGDEDWMRCSGYLFRPLETIPSLEFGTSMKITVKEKNLTSWVRLERSQEQASIVLNAPNNVRWKIYDYDFTMIAIGFGSVNVSPGETRQHYYVALYAEPGQTMDLSWR